MQIVPKMPQQPLPPLKGRNAFLEDIHGRVHYPRIYITRLFEAKKPRTVRRVIENV